MERKEEIIDLGTASTVTQGPGGVGIDELLGQFAAGLSDD